MERQSLTNAYEWRGLELGLGESTRIQDFVVTLLAIENGQAKFLFERLSSHDNWDADDDGSHCEESRSATDTWLN